MAQKTSGRLVTIAAAAVTAIYVTGYLTTAGASASLDPTAVVATLAPTAAVVATSTTAPTAAPSASATPKATATATGAYRDGTYTGTGTSRRGGFDVAVTVAGGRITNVAITRAFTEYPASRVAALPSQVVARQSASVDKVTGATFSSQAFQQAVAAALAQAAA